MGATIRRSPANTAGTALVGEARVPTPSDNPGDVGEELADHDPGIDLSGGVAPPTGFSEFPAKDGALQTRPVSTLLAGRVDSLDGLRGLAAAAVVVFHLGLVSGGWLAVDLFFTLSGFLITTLLVREWAGTDRIRLGGFWGRRARRLLPAVAVLLALVAVLTFLEGTTSAVSQRQAWASALYIANWTAVFSPQTYWEIFTSQSPLEHTWSLAIEEQFYLVWPLVCLVVLRLAKGRIGALAATTAALLGASFAAMLWLYSGEDTNRVYFGTDTRAASILVGALLACWLAVRPQHVGAGPATWGALPRHRLVGRVALEAVALIGLVALLAAWVTTEGTNPLVYRGGLVVHAAVAAAVIATAVHPVRGLIARGLSVRPLVWLGIISYGIYLFHWPVIWWLTPQRTGLDGAALAVVRVVATLVIAALSWVLIERNVLRGRVSLRLALPAVTVAAVISVVVVAVTPLQTQPGDLALAVAGADDSAGTKAAFSLPAAPPTTTANLAFPPAPPPYRVLFVGDSLPYSIAKNWQPDPSQIVTGSVAIPSCDGARGGGIRFPLNVYVQDKPDCQNWGQLWPDALALFQPDAVVVMLGTAAIQERQVDGVYTKPCQPRYDNWYTRELDVRLSLLEQLTKAPILMALAPYAEDRSIGVLPADHRARTDCLNTIYRDAAGRHPGVQLVDFAGWVCPDGMCRQELDGQLFRPDGLHLAPPAATAAGNWLVDQAKLVGLARLNASQAPAAATDPATNDENPEPPTTGPVPTTVP